MEKPVNKKVILIGVSLMIIIIVVMLSLTGCHDEYDNIQPTSCPTASFTFSPQVIDTSTIVQFNASASVDDESYVLTYVWDLNHDGRWTEESSSPVINYKFNTSGEHVVSLKVIDEIGWSGLHRETITVH